jgi:hypothetical protein
MILSVLMMWTLVSYLWYLLYREQYELKAGERRNWSHVFQTLLVSLIVVVVPGTLCGVLALRFMQTQGVTLTEYEVNFKAFIIVWCQIGLLSACRPMLERVIKTPPTLPK